MAKYEELVKFIVTSNGNADKRLSECEQIVLRELLYCNLHDKL